MVAPRWWNEPEGRRTGAWAVGCVLAVICLLGQMLWYRFDPWAGDADLRFLYRWGCAAVGCELPVMRSLADLSVRRMAVRAHPDVPDAVVLDAVIANTAPYAQAFPVVELRFANAAGETVAARRFEPAEYLGEEFRGGALMPAMAPVAVSVELGDPGRDAVNASVILH